MKALGLFADSNIVAALWTTTIPREKSSGPAASPEEEKNQEQSQRSNSTYRILLRRFKSCLSVPVPQCLSYLDKLTSDFAAISTDHSVAGVDHFSPEFDEAIHLKVLSPSAMTTWSREPYSSPTLAAEPEKRDTRWSARLGNSSPYGKELLRNVIHACRNSDYAVQGEYKVCNTQFPRSLVTIIHGPPVSDWKGERENRHLVSPTKYSSPSPWVCFPHHSPRCHSSCSPPRCLKLIKSQELECTVT